MCRPLTVSATSASPLGVRSRNRGWRSRSRVTSSAVTSPPIAEAQHPGRCSSHHGGHPLVGGVEDSGAVGGQRLHQLAFGLGDAIDAAEHLSVRGGDPGDDADLRLGDRTERGDVPGPRAPISMTATSASSGALRSVSGTPSSLLNERSLAVDRNRVRRTAESRSLAEVLPTDPVMPTTGPTSRARARRPASSSAASSVFDDHRGAADRASRREVGSRTGGHRGLNEVVAVALGNDRHEQLARADSRVNRWMRHGS